MKRKTCLLLLLALLLALTGITACTPSGPSDDQPDEPPVPMMDIATDGQCLYRVVRGELYTTESTEVTVAVRIMKAMGSILGNMPSIVTDWEDKDDNAEIREILVGKTNRPESEEVYASLGVDQYAICVKGNKIVIAGSSDELLRYAATRFLSDYCGYTSEEAFTPSTTLSIPEELHVKEVFTMPGSVAIYQSKSVSYAKDLSEKLTAAGFMVTEYTTDADPKTVFDAAMTDLVIVVGADTATTQTVSALQKYLEEEGRVLFLGGPAFENILYEMDGNWYSRADYGRALFDLVDPDNTEILLNFSDEDFVNRHSRSTSHPGNAYEAICDDFDLEDSDAQLYHYVDKMENWDMVHYGNLTVRGEGYNALGFYAKPDDDATYGFVFEIKDTHGARWYSNVTFTSNDWAYYLLTPSDFIWWKDGAKPQTDVPVFDDIASVQIGFANSFRGVAVGSYGYYCSDVTLFHTKGTLPTQAAPIMLEGVSPMHELYPITNAASLVTCDNQVFLQSREYIIPSELISCHPGRTGTGFDKGATTRFVPLIRVTDEKGLHAGYAAWLHLFSSKTTKNGQLEGAIVGTFGAESADFYNANGIAAVVETAQAMVGKAFLVDGGTTEHIYVTADTESITAGATYTAKSGTTPQVSIDLYQGDQVISHITGEQAKPKSIQNGLHTVSAQHALKDGKPDRAVVTLSIGEQVIDTLVQPISYWEAKPENERSYIYMEDGYFKKDGKILNLFGVNYMPSSGVSEADGQLFEHYISDAAYDPEVILYDLQHIKDIGMNAVSIFCYYDHVKGCNNILDLVNKCEQMGIYVDLSIRPLAYPLKNNYSYDQVQTLVQRLHFHENENIVAFDIAWEPRVGSYEENSMYVGRQRWDAQWLQWIKDHYGSVDHAFSLWGVKIPKNNAGVPVITDAMLDNSAPTYKKAIAAYYRFLDEIIAADMQVHMPAMQALAPHHLFSFRMSMSGSTMRVGGTYPSNMCFDFQSLASTMAFMEPEGYALGLSDEASLQIMFANAYARYTKPDAPVVWKEFGRHVWTGLADGNFDPDSSLLETQARYYQYALDYCLKSYTSGMFCWYYAGGFRVGENSDYGILNPDGSDRPVTALLREYAPKFIGQGERDTIEIAIERDDSIGGLYGMFDAVKGQLAQAYAQGKAVTFINKQQDSATEYAYADALLDYAVGGTEAKGSYPLRYVGGQIMEISFEGDVAKITVCNTKQSTWRAGTVRIVSTADSAVNLNTTIDTELSYLERTTITAPVSGSGTLILRFEIDGKPFGIRYETKK